MIVVHIYINYLNMYINNYTTHFIEQISIYQLNNTDILITILDILGK